MLQRLLTGLVCLLFLFQSSAQTDIRFDIKNYSSDTMIVGYYLAEKMLVYDSLYREDGSTEFIIERDSLLDPGMYMVVSVPEGMFYQFLVNSEDQEFKMSIDTTLGLGVTFEGSEENGVFYEYLDFIDKARKETDRIERVIAETDSVLVTVRQQLREDQMAINQAVGMKQNQVIENYPNSIVALLLNSNKPFDFPQFEGTPDEIQQKRYRIYKEKYFELMDMQHPAMLRTPIVDQRVNYYLDNLTPIDPDSAIASVDRILGLMEGNEDLYRYYLSTFLSKYGNSKYIGMDAVYVHLALNYYGKGRAPWITGENLQEIITNAKRIEPILIGKPAPDFSIQSQDGRTITLSELDNEYTVLVFWKPNCGHCTKAMPHVIEFEKKWKDKGIQTIAICTMTGKDFGKCWEDVKAKGMESLINAGDEFRKSRIFSKYYTTSTPKIFIIDKDKNIKIKKVPAENLDAVMESLMKMDAAEAGQ